MDAFFWVELKRRSATLPPVFSFVFEEVYIKANTVVFFSFLYKSFPPCFGQNSRQQFWDIFLTLLKLSVKSPSLSPPIPSAFTTISPLSMVVVKESKKFLSNLSMKCWNSAFNAQGSRVTIVVVVQVGAVKIICSSSSGGAHEKGKEGMKLSLSPKLVGKN